MAKNDNLKDFLTDVADAIREKKGTEDKINPQNFADEIRDIHEEVDMLGFSKIGYTKENDGGIQEAVNYAYNLAKGWNPDGSTSQMFSRNTQLVFAPMVDTSKYTSLAYMFEDCKVLTTIPKLDTSSVTDMSTMFDGCEVLTTIPQFDTSRVTNMSNMFQRCTSLRFIPILNAKNCKSMGYAFDNCSNLEVILELDMSSCVHHHSAFDGCSKLRYMKVTNIGKATTQYKFATLSSWGTGGEENRQSLIDSLITYSYDRVSNGMATATITLSANTKALLTEEEIAQITAKGFTIA